MTNYIALLWDSLIMNDCKSYYASKNFIFIEWQTICSRLKGPTIRFIHLFYGTLDYAYMILRYNFQYCSALALGHSNITKLVCSFVIPIIWIVSGANVTEWTSNTFVGLSLNGISCLHNKDCCPYDLFLSPFSRNLRV